MMEGKEWFSYGYQDSLIWKRYESLNLGIVKKPVVEITLSSTDCQRGRIMKACSEVAPLTRKG